MFLTTNTLGDRASSSLRFRLTPTRDLFGSWLLCAAHGDVYPADSEISSGHGAEAMTSLAPQS